ncbi:MAG: hypothetical protein M3P43_01840 [Actinomycetota bacterium]|nr:hypothetical protein [Actinomycetota bacterium]
MRFRIVRGIGRVQRIQVAEGVLRPGHLLQRHYYRTGLPGTPRDRVVTHQTRYLCSCGREWYGVTPTSADVLRHDLVGVRA